VQTVIEEVVVFAKDVVYGGTLRQAGNECVPGRLYDLYHHVVAQVLDQGQHFLSETKGRMIGFE